MRRREKLAKICSRSVLHDYSQLRATIIQQNRLLERETLANDKRPCSVRTRCGYGIRVE